MLGPRREVVRRVVSFEDFSLCWETDRQAARGYVQQVRDLVGAKDSATRIQEHVAARQSEELAERRAKNEVLRQKREAMAAVKGDLYALFREDDAQKRGKALEGVLNRLFQTYGILVEESFAVRGNPGEGIIEQIDGVVRIDAPCLVEMKWLKGAVSVGDAAQHLIRVFSRPEVRGLLIAVNGFSPGVEAQHRDALVKGRVVTLCGLDELIRVLEQEYDLAQFLRAKMDAAMLRREPYPDRLANPAMFRSLDPEPGSATERQALRRALERGEKVSCPWCGEMSAIRSWGDGRVRLDPAPVEGEGPQFIHAAEPPPTQCP